MSSLASLTTEQKLKAFKKTRDEINIPGCKLVLVTEEYYDDYMRFYRESFMVDEPTNESVGMTWTPELESYVISVLRHNLSIMLINKEDDDVMAIRTMRVQTVNDTFKLDNSKTNKLNLVHGFMQFCDEKSNFFEFYNINEAIHFHGLGVGEKYRRRGLGTEIQIAAIRFAQNLGIYPIYMKGQASSHFAKRIYEKLGFDLVKEIFFEEFKVDGEVVLSNTEDHKSRRSYGLTITSSVRIH